MPSLLTQPVELVIFDWDGTLMDSEAVIVSCMQGAIRDMALEPRTDSEISNIIGLGLLEAVTALYPGSNPTFAEQMADHYRTHWLQTSQGREDLFPGVIPLIEGLHQDGIKTAIATGKSRRGLDHVLQVTEIGSLFHSSRCADETRSKPHPQMLHEILEELAVPAAAAVMVGDTEYDLKMASRAEMASIGVCYGVHSASRLQRHQPLACVEALETIRELLPPPAPAF